MPDITATTGLAGYFKIESKQPDGTVKVLADWFPNLITDQGMNRIGSAASVAGIWNNCHLGSGTTAPAVTDTALQSFVVGVGPSGNPIESATTSPPYFTTLTLAYVFAQGAVVGNFSEIGVGWATSGATLFSRSLIKDGSGNPTTITVTAIEQLTVYYSLRLYPPQTDTVSVVSIGGVSTTVNVRPYGIASSLGGGSSTGFHVNGIGTTGWITYGQSEVYNGLVGAITGFPSGVVAYSVTRSALAYSNNSFYRDLVFSFSTTQGNLAGGISSALASVQPGKWQIGFAPAIAKDNTKTLSLTLRVGWARRP